GRGSIGGAAGMPFLPELLQGFVDFRLIVYGAMIVAFLYALPLGIVGTLFRRSTLLPDAAVVRDLAFSQSALVDAGSVGRAPASAGQAVATLQGVHMSFGGVRALNGIDLSVAQGTIHPLIAPTGAGKTVLLNVLSGYYPPTEGRVMLTGRRVTGLAPHRVAQLGLARTFQTAQLFGQMSVLQNVLAGFPGQIRGR